MTFLGRQRVVAAATMGVVLAASVLTGRLWPVVVDSGGVTAAHNPVSRYGPHWLYPVVAAVVLVCLVAVIWTRPHRIGVAAALIAFAAGATGNLGERLILGGVSNPIGILGGHASIGDACLWLGALASVGSLLLGSDGAHPARRPCFGRD